MAENNRFWRPYAAPIILSIGALCGVNALWNLKFVEKNLDHSLIVYLLAGSGLALVLLWRALKDGRLTRRDLGLDSSAWSPGKRLIGVAMILMFSYGAYSKLQYSLPPGVIDSADQSLIDELVGDDASESMKVVNKPPWRVFCYWFVVLLAASLAELLVFVGLGFCLLERGLKQRGMKPAVAACLAAIFSSVTFGLYHYSHGELWWSMVFFPLMPVMAINLICFVLTRNFYLTLGVHGSFAALGVTVLLYMDPKSLSGPDHLLPTLLAFAVPFLVLHWFEGIPIQARRASE